MISFSMGRVLDRAGGGDRFGPLAQGAPRSAEVRHASCGSPRRRAASTRNMVKLLFPPPPSVAAALVCPAAGPARWTQGAARLRHDRAVGRASASRSASWFCWSSVRPAQCRTSPSRLRGCDRPRVPRCRAVHRRALRARRDEAIERRHRSGEQAIGRRSRSRRPIRSSSRSPAPATRARLPRSSCGGKAACASSCITCAAARAWATISRSRCS